MAGDAGWIRLHRKALQSAVFKCPYTWHLWCWCKMRANWEDTDVVVDRLSDPVPVKRGQFITGRESMNRSLYPDQRKSDPSAETTFRRLKKLEKMGNVHLETHSRFTLVTVVNFEVYNPLTTQNDQQVPARCTAGDQQVTSQVTSQMHTDKKKKEEEEGKEEEKGSSYEEPRRAQPATAKPKRVDSRDINAVIERYQKHHPRSRPGENERKKIAARLKDGYSVADLCKAIDGNHVSPWHCGENDDSREYHALELIVRNTAKVDQFIALADTAGKPVLSKRTQKSLRAGQQWLDSHKQKDNSDAGV